MSRTVIYTNGDHGFTSPTQLDDTKIRLAGTGSSPPAAPLINLTGLLAMYTLDKVEVLGTSVTPNYGWVQSYPTLLPPSQMVCMSRMEHCLPIPTAASLLRARVSSPTAARSTHSADDITLRYTR